MSSNIRLMVRCDCLNKIIINHGVYRVVVEITITIGIYEVVARHVSVDEIYVVIIISKALTAIHANKVHIALILNVR